MALSEAQIFNLNCLTYLPDNILSKVKPGDTVETLLGILKNPENRTVPDSSGRECSESIYAESTYHDVFEAISKDPTLMNMTINAHRTLSEGGAAVLVFSGSDGHGGKEAVVAYEGSQSAEDWRQNLAMARETDTPSQMEAASILTDSTISKVLSSCDTITTTGHSKGGNDANYAYLMNGNVTRSVTFDAPGFSDEFIAANKDTIASRQANMDNYSAHNDFVNFLLNSVGQQHYIQNNGPKEGNAFYDRYMAGASSEWEYAHEPMAMNYFFNNNGQPVSECAQDPGIAALDRMMNSYLRTHANEKGDATDLLGEVLATAFYRNQAHWGDCLLAVVSGTPEALEMVGFIGDYINKHPSDGAAILGFLSNINPSVSSFFSSLSQFIGAMSNPVFHGLLGLVLKGSKPLSWLLSIIGIKTGPLSAVLLRLLSLVAEAVYKSTGGYEDIGGDDIVVGAPPFYAHLVQGLQNFQFSFSGQGGHDKKRFNSVAMQQVLQELKSLSSELNSISSQMGRSISDCDKYNFTMTVKQKFAVVSGSDASGKPAAVLRRLRSNTNAAQDSINKLCDNINKVIQLMEEAENANAQMFGAGM